MKRILVGVRDSGPALAAAAAAIDLAQGWSADLNLVAVTEPGFDDGTVLDHVGDKAIKAGVATTITTTPGVHPFEALLAIAHEWGADLIVVGQSDRRRPGRPYVGSQTEHLLEFTDIPVLVVPDRPRRIRRGMPR